MSLLFNVLPESFAVLSGDDSVTLPLMALGGRGIISVVSNEIPAEMSRLAAWCLEGDFARAREIHRRYLPLMEVNFVESNPIPVKAALALMGLIEPVYRLPMVPPQPANQAKIEKVLATLGLLEARPAVPAAAG
jgi:4-hydroxy-tetrahydrodipicolinate synthase